MVRPAEMTVLLPFVINAGMNFVLGLLVALFLGPDEFGRYAIGAAIIVLVNTALMDWLKLSAVRFYSQAARQTQPEIRATLDVLAAGISLSLCALLVAAVAAGIDFRLPAMLVSAAVLAGITAGLFDYHGAIARARYLDAAYARMMLVKNLLGLVLMVGGAWWLRDATTVLLGGLASTAASLVGRASRPCRCAIEPHWLSQGPGLELCLLCAAACRGQRDLLADPADQPLAPGQRAWLCRSRLFLARLRYRPAPVRHVGRNHRNRAAARDPAGGGGEGQGGGAPADRQKPAAGPADRPPRRGRAVLRAAGL